jgi:LysR family transcriptional regulator, transcription activator of glutamate synthase operon
MCMAATVADERHRLNSLLSSQPSRNTIVPVELRQLRYFAAVAGARHFTRAAQELHVAQSAISHQVVKLERELGIELLSRSPRRVDLTHAGELVLGRASRILGEVAALEGEIAELKGLVRGRVAFGGVVPMGPLDVADLLASFHERHPGVEVTLLEATTRELHALVHRDELDLALSLALPESAYADVEGERLFEEEFVVVMAPDHPLATSSRPLPTAGLAPYAVIGFYPGSVTREAIDQHLAEAGIRPRVAYESSLVDLSRRLASHGLGVAILPRSTVEGPGPPVAVRSLRPRLTRDITLVWRRDRKLSPAAAALLAHVRLAAAAARAG